MKTTQSKTEAKKLIELFEQLIPADATSSEVTTEISGAFLKLRYETAQSIRTDNPNLAKEEMARFAENCKIADVVKLGIELRNYLLFEIYSTEQYRQTDQDFVAFGMRMTELSKPQLWKCVHAGRIRVAMIQSDLDEVRPTGRQVESLSRIEEAHTIPAWLYALDYMRVNGRSDATATEALKEYCKIKKIPYGKRMPNGSRKVSIQKALKNDKATKDLKPDDDAAMDAWSLNKHEQQLILGLDPEVNLSLTGNELDSQLQKHIIALKNVASKNQLSDYEARHAEELLALVMRKDEHVGRSLALLALNSIKQLVMNEISAQAKVDKVQQKSKNDHP